MISFRFHVVSITAVFLAIAIGIVVGSTYVDRAIVENLRERVDDVSSNLDERRAEIARLEDALEDADEYIRSSADFTVSDRLVDQPVLVVAPRGVDEEAVEEVAALARRAGARVPGVLWLEPAWALGQAEERARLAELVGGDADDEAARLLDEAWDDVVAELVAEADGEPAEEAPDPAADPSTTTTTEAPPEPSVPTLDDLQARGFVTLDPLDDSTVSLAEMADAVPGLLVVTGSAVEDDLQPVVAAVADSAASADLPTVVAHVFVEREGGAGRGDELGALLAEPLRAELVMVDDADQLTGRVASVLALATADTTPGAHYGQGSGAEGRLPVWTSP